MISTPRQAEIRVQGLNDRVRVEVVSLDDLLESNMEIPISERYALMLDFQWLVGTDDTLDAETHRQSIVDTELAPWLICNYRF